jgi:hypothetical protein
LRADAVGNGFDHDQLSLKAKVLIDSFLFHLLAAKRDTCRNRSSYSCSRLGGSLRRNLSGAPLDSLLRNCVSMALAVGR